MTLAINPANDAEISRQKRNLTQAQSRNLGDTKQGVVVNSQFKEADMTDVYSSLLISQESKMPEKLKENKITQDKSLLPLSIIATGVMGLIAGFSMLAKRSIKSVKNLSPEHKLPDMIRNVNINKEEVQSIYQIVHCPNRKTILAGIGVITLGAMAFMGKMFMDGFKQVWVKKREADIQKNLQENLIAVETQSFAGKMQIIRSMLSEKAKDFSAYICPECKKSDIPFKGASPDALKANSDKPDKPKNSNIKYFALGAATLVSIVGLAFLSLKNLTKGKKELESFIKMKKGEISEFAKNSTQNTKEADKPVLKKLLQGIDADSEFVSDTLSKANWSDTEKNEFIKSVNAEIRRSTTDAPFAVGGSGTPKPAFNSYIDNYKTFLYNYLLDSDNPQFKMLFLGVTGLSALTYGGEVLGEGVKEVQVKKMNAQTELDLQTRLVSTELRNFKSKKEAVINPLCEEFYAQANQGKSKEDLKKVAENILFEIKNGPPYVYS